ncbi:unnamed protein product [Vitrella brassicaformis CCMP3155]|uniref:Uncharacterized protein n=1 Tax=Vitrella brassicaformis (strain CCMP3155) TaxID=1169540 RepID=A0A0G4FB44_VITBC|nr:unnamed protein product [Vitrella brassicaformis CCMP3155]|eukprot:CEM10158.1 unnamed protein product [Vitrella brassicaformis CCMP3155]
MGNKCCSLWTDPDPEPDCHFEPSLPVDERRLVFHNPTVPSFPTHRTGGGFGREPGMGLHGPPRRPEMSALGGRTGVPTFGSGYGFVTDCSNGFVTHTVGMPPQVDKQQTTKGYGFVTHTVGMPPQVDEQQTTKTMFDGAEAAKTDSRSPNVGSGERREWLADMPGVADKQRYGLVGEDKQQPDKQQPSQTNTTEQGSHSHGVDLRPRVRVLGVRGVAESLQNNPILNAFAQEGDMEKLTREVENKMKNMPLPACLDGYVREDGDSEEQEAGSAGEIKYSDRTGRQLKIAIRP